MLKKAKQLTLNRVLTTLTKLFDKSPGRLQSKMEDEHKVILQGQGELCERTQQDLYQTLRKQPGMTFKFVKQGNKFVYTLCDGELLYQLGQTPSSVVGKDVREVKSRENVLYSLQHYLKAWEGEDIVQYEEFQNGITYMTSLRPIKNNGVVKEVIGFSMDISDRKVIEAEIKHMAYHDDLTDLPNRRQFMDHIFRKTKRGMKSQQEFSILLIDLDNFKQVNDSIGHAIGDDLLKAAVIRLKKCVASKGMIARLGGDEFAVLLDKVNGKSMMHFANEVAETIIQEFATSIDIQEYELFVTTSIGIGCFPVDGKCMDELLKNAEMAMYAAKSKGKNNYQHFDSELNKQLRIRLDLENGLRRAIENDEFKIKYQPKMDSFNNSLTGVEALLRWNHPELGAVPPTTFIPLAEETGLIIPIGEWVLHKACSTLKCWHDSGFENIKMAVNLSGKQLNQKNFVGMVKNILEETGVKPESLELEITESMTLDVEWAFKILKDLKSIGIKLSMDDFGTGYSSLNYLKNFPIDTLKIDRSFVMECTTNEKDAAMVKTIIKMAHHLDLRVVAEGVETSEHLTFLIDHECDEAQGYLFSEPIDASEIEKRFLKNVSANENMR
ncbi:GGDEF domain-containing phosphodiesterase [Bacillus sp. UNCCL13]|nr:GGDEF domain-containing phosphodiesterase [Bacillus sp. UNCCL13]